MFHSNEKPQTSYIEIWDKFMLENFIKSTKIVSEYDQEIPQSQPADKPMAPRGNSIPLNGICQYHRID